jgi:hypothetical protein
MVSRTICQYCSEYTTLTLKEDVEELSIINFSAASLRFVTVCLRSTIFWSLGSLLSAFTAITSKWSRYLITAVWSSKIETAYVGTRTAAATR